MEEAQEFINLTDAAKILSEKRGAPVHPYYIRQLRKRGTLRAINESPERSRATSTHTLIFRRADVEAIDIGPPKIRGVRTPRKPRPKKPRQVEE